MRNVTGDPWAGVCEGELFDPTPYAGAYVRYFVRHPTTQLMPRKIKTAFTATDEDRAITGIHDIAFLPRDRATASRGFEVRVGGGTSIMPRVAPTLYDFVEADNGDYLKVAEAVLRIFDRQDWLRVNRARARIKVFVDKFGIDELRRQVEEELQGDWVAERDFSIDPHALRSTRRSRTRPPCRADLRLAQRRPAASSSASASPTSPRSARRASRRSQVKVTRGDLTPGAVPRPRRRSCATSPAATPARRSHQNLVLRWVRDEAVYDVWRRLHELGLGDAGADEINDVVCCPGTDSCKLGITCSMGLNAAIQERVESMEITDPLTKRIHIKMSGCPNGCSQHHIANIGFYGASIKVGEHTLPAYVAHIGGNYEGGEVVYGTRLKVRLPAKRVPDAVERWIRHLRGRPQGGRGVQRLRRARRHQALRGRRQGRPRAAGRVRRWRR